MSSLIKCLEKDDENRYQSVPELLIDLRRLSTGMSKNVALDRPNHLRRALTTAGMALLPILLLLLARHERWVGATRTRIESLAVSALENLSHDPEQGYLADGMTFIDTSTDTQLWSRSYQRELGDLLTLHRELALTIANEIKTTLTAQEQERLKTPRSVPPPKTPI